MKTLLLRTSPPGALTLGFRSPLVSQPLGVMQLAACIRARRRGDVVRVVDAAVQFSSASDIRDVIEQFQPDVLGLSGLSLEEPVVRELLEVARSCAPDLYVVAGGPMSTGAPERILGIEGVDLACIGEGEETIVDVLDALQGNRDPGSVPGVARIVDGELKRTRTRAFIRDLGALPPLDYEDVDISLYSKVNSFNDLPPFRSRYMSMMTTRGCPHHCTFCHGMMGRKVRACSPKRVVDEMQRLITEQGVREFHIVDDIFNFKKGRIAALCDQIASRNLDVSFAFPNGLRGDRIQPGEMELLASAGCTSMSLAIESVSQRIQKLIRKHLDVEHVFRAAQEARQTGIFTRGFVMLGFPTETSEEMVHSIERMRNSSFDTVYVQPVIPYPGTGLFELAMENGFVPDQHFGYAYDYRHGGAINASNIDDHEFKHTLLMATDWIHEEPRRQLSLRRFYEHSAVKEHPLFRTQGQWKKIVPGWTG